MIGASHKCKQRNPFHEILPRVTPRDLACARAISRVPMSCLGAKHRAWAGCSRRAPEIEGKKRPGRWQDGPGPWPLWGLHVGSGPTRALRYNCGGSGGRRRLWAGEDFGRYLRGMALATLIGAGCIALSPRCMRTRKPTLPRYPSTHKEEAYRRRRAAACLWPCRPHRQQNRKQPVARSSRTCGKTLNPCQSRSGGPRPLYRVPLIRTGAPIGAIRWT
jgi:hypothetical protein